MDTNANESLRLHAFLVMGDMKSNNYFGILHIIGLYFAL